MTKTSSKWLQGVQYFRAVAIIEIIAGHAFMVAGLQGSAAALGPLKGAIIVFFSFFTTFGVPHFIFISGLVLYNKYHAHFSVSMFYKRRFGTVLPPYLIWSTFYFFVYVAAARLFDLLHYPTPNGLAFNSISSTTQLLNQYLIALSSGFVHLWFIVLLMQLYALYPLLAKFYYWFSSKRNPVYGLLLLLLIQIVYSGLAASLATSKLQAGGKPNPLLEFFLVGIFYFVLGFFVAEHYETIQQRIAGISLRVISPAVVISTMWLVSVNYKLLPGVPQLLQYLAAAISAPLYCMLLIVLYLRIGILWGEPRGFFTKWVEKIGENSFGIYLTNFLFFIAFVFILPKVGLNPQNLLFYPTLTFLVLFFSYASVQMLYRLPFASVIIGQKRQSKRRQIVQHDS